MRFVRKGPEPESLREFKALANPPDWLPTYDGLPQKRKSVIDSFLDDCLTDDDRERFLNDYLTERASSPSEFISAVRSVLLPASNSKLGVL